MASNAFSSETDFPGLDHYLSLGWWSRSTVRMDLETCRSHSLSSAASLFPEISVSRSLKTKGEKRLVAIEVLPRNDAFWWDSQKWYFLFDSHLYPTHAPLGGYYTLIDAVGYPITPTAKACLGWKDPEDAPGVACSALHTIGVYPSPGDQRGSIYGPGSFPTVSLRLHFVRRGYPPEHVVFYAAVVLASDEYLALRSLERAIARALEAGDLKTCRDRKGHRIRCKARAAVTRLHRFLLLAIRLPQELQMVLCRRGFGLLRAGNIILARHFERAVPALIRLL